MNNKFNILILVLLLGFTSCNDWLTIEPENELIQEEFWKSGEDVQGILASAYGSLRNISDEMFYWGELRGGNLTQGNSPTNQQLEIYDFNIFAENTLVKWDNYYKAISYANTLLKFAPQVLDVDPSYTLNELKVAEAEATFIRSLCYFHLVRAFRDVPLILEPYTSDAMSVSVPKTPEADIITQIISDLEAVRAYAPESFERDNYELNHTKGRATLFAIDALLADIYLWSNQYEKCITYCDNVINSFNFGLVSGDEYFTLYSPGNSIEGIFEIQSDRNLGQTNNHYSLTANFSGGTQDAKVSNEFITLFSPSDKRGNGVSYDVGTQSIWKYIGYEGLNTANVRTSGSQSDSNWIIYRLSEMYLMKAEAFYEQEKYAEATGMLKIIMGRAGLTNVSLPEGDDLLDAILEERAKEFVGEGKRWFDLVRIARRDIENRKNIISNAVLLNVSPQYFVSVKSKINDPDSWFLPIYFKELEINSELEQNPFYAN